MTAAETSDSSMVSYTKLRNSRQSNSQRILLHNRLREIVAITPKIIPQELFCVSNFFEGGGSVAISVFSLGGSRKGRGGCVRNIGHEHDFSQTQQAENSDPRKNYAVKYATARGHLTKTQKMGTFDPQIS